MTRREFSLGLAGLAASSCGRQRPANGRDFVRMTVHWQHYEKPGYLEFLREVRPDIVQVGFYGADFWSIAHLPDTARGLSGPLMPSHAGLFQAQDPAERLRKSAEYFEQLNREVKKTGAKVIGHFDVVKYLLGDPANRTGGFFRFYNELWDEKELGPRPVADPVELLQRDRDGKPIVHDDEDARPFGVYFGCLNNPHWKAVLKVWVKRGIERGLDGYVINYFYRHNCLCRYCQDGFRAHLRERFSPEELRARLGIPNLDGYRFESMPGRHVKKDETPLDVESRRYSDISNKLNFDEVFIDYGRKLKPDLIVAQWLHLYDFRYPPHGPTDERELLPAELWSKGEDYIWYCVGGARKPTGIDKGILGDGTLAMRYIRAAGGDKPFTICQYERMRVRAIFAEAAANGGMAMSNYSEFFDPAARVELVRYYRFLQRYDALYRGNRPHAEAALLFPRQNILAGRYREAMEPFHQTALELMNRHVLFDIASDDRNPDLSGYRQVCRAGETPVLEGLSFFEAPGWVRVAGNRPAEGDEIDLHFVNYNRDEQAPVSRGGVEDDRPIAVEPFRCDLLVPGGYRATRVEVVTPEEPDPVQLEIRGGSGRVQFTLPRFLVYSVARVYLERGGSAAGVDPLPRPELAKIPAAAPQPAPLEPFAQGECTHAF